MLPSPKISCVGIPRTSREKTQQSTVNKLFLFLVVMLLVCPVISLEESFCAGTGWHNLHYGGQLYGYRTAGWDRLFAVNVPWTSYFWSVSARDDDLSVGNLIPSISVNFVEYRDASTQYTLNGWLHVQLERPAAAFHYVAIWAVNKRNEPYGSFILTADANFADCYPKKEKLYNMSYAYIPCSAGVANAETVSNMFIFADLDRAPSDDINQASFVQANVKAKGASKGPTRLSVLWRAPAQTFCNRPVNFKFIYAVTPKSWENYAIKDWNYALKPDKMWAGRDSGPLIRASNWMSPKFYGHPSNYDPYDKLQCGDTVEDRDWLYSVGPYPPHPFYWYSTAVWPIPNPGDALNTNGNYNAEDPKKRSTCKGLKPTDNYILGFGGRCSASVNEAHLSYHEAFNHVGPNCKDQNDQWFLEHFKKHYDSDKKGSYLKALKTRLESTCECTIYTNQTISLSLKILMMPPPLPWHPGVSRSVKLRNYNMGEYHRDHDFCSIDKLNLSSNAINDRGGICVQTPVGKLVYGVRQWHGVTSLCNTIVLTPLSIFIARYTKGDMILLDGKVTIRAWYLTHVVLVFPAIWMYASSMATISRQVDVLGHSMTYAAAFHRTAGIFTMGLIPFNIVTGFIRPVNLKARNILIFLHWFAGLLYHFLELLLCCFSYLIPASPTTKSSIFSRYADNLYRSSRVSGLILGWFVFSLFFNVLLTYRVWRHDRKMGDQGRSVFPIIIPLFTRDARQDLVDAEHSHELCFERGALFIFGLVSCIVFAVSIISLYQALHEKLYYGFGPMTCTHNEFGEFISDNNASGSEQFNDACHRL